MFCESKPEESLGLRAGDTCSVLQVSPQESCVCVLVHQHIRNRALNFPIVIAWVPVIWTEGSRATFLFKKARTQMVKRVSLRSPAPTNGICGLCSENSSKCIVPAYGKLEGGDTYFIYRALLYGDGFSQYNDKQGSAAGLYMLPLNLPFAARSSRKAVRILALTPPGVSTNDVIHALLPDIVRMATKGITVLDADGNSIRLFLDILAFVADYPEVAHCLDVVRHLGSSPCHLCAFRRMKNGPNSRYAHTTEIHSQDSAFMRTGPRTEAMGSAEVTSQEYNNLGMKGSHEHEAINSPLHALHKALKEAVRATKLPKTENGVPVVVPFFDQYRSTMVAPDHLLTIGKNLLNAAFALLPNDNYRKSADTRIRDALRSNGLILQNKIYGFKDRKLYATNLSGTFCTLRLATAVFDDFCIKIDTDSTATEADLAKIKELAHIINLYGELVAETQWYPKYGVDTSKSIQDFNRDAGSFHLNKLELRALSFLNQY